MKRVRNFLVLKTNAPAIGLRRRVSASLRAASDCKRIAGWHPSWKEAVLCLRSPSVHEVAIVDGDGLGNVIAIFSRRGFDASAQIVTPKTKWNRVCVKGHEDFCCFLNQADYAWDWVSGAKHEVPFRLKFFERQALAKPNGLVAKAYALVSEFRDLVLGPPRTVG